MTTQVMANQFGANTGGALWIKRAAMFAGGVAALTLSAKTTILLEPVPVTLQVLVVMAIGLGYGARMGALTVLAYLALGAAGEPVFAGTPVKGVGLPYMLGSTGGYLMGFVAAAGVVGWLADRGWDRNVLTTVVALALGLVALYIPGVLWLAYGFPITALGAEFSGFGIAKGLEWGVLPFIWIDALKLSLAAIAFPAVWRWLGRA